METPLRELIWWFARVRHLVGHLFGNIAPLRDRTMPPLPASLASPPYAHTVCKPLQRLGLHKQRQFTSVFLRRRIPVYCTGKTIAPSFLLISSVGSDGFMLPPYFTQMCPCQRLCFFFHCVLLRSAARSQPLPS